MRRLSAFAVVVACLSGVGALSPARVARADVTTWLAFGGGLALDHSTANGSTNFNPAFSASMGVGSDPTHPWVLGGVFRSMSRFNEGTDIGFAARFTTGGFSRGDWGFAVDLGPSLRLWGNDTFGQYPLQADVVLGAPWGLQLTVGSDLVNLEGHPSSVGGFAVFEIDLFRFTLLRQGSTDAFWKVPLPAGGREPGETPR